MQWYVDYALRLTVITFIENLIYNLRANSLFRLVFQLIYNVLCKIIILPLRATYLFRSLKITTRSHYHIFNVYLIYFMIKRPLMCDFTTFRQKRRNFESSYLKIWMLKFEIVNTVIKLMTVIFMLYLCMYQTVAGRGSIGSQRWWTKSQPFFHLWSRLSQAFLSCFSVTLTFHGTIQG